LTAGSKLREWTTEEGRPAENRSGSRGAGKKKLVPGVSVAKPRRAAQGKKEDREEFSV